MTVALHSGFCLRRHYMAFAGLKYGAGVRDFLDRLVARRLARRSQFRPDRGHVYHLHNTRIYAAINQDDNRNRRRTSPALIARKLMLLDYVLGQPAADWYATEQDKVALFTDAIRHRARRTSLSACISHAVYDEPNTSRYFIHKLPIFLTGEPPVGVVRVPRDRHDRPRLQPVSRRTTSDCSTGSRPGASSPSRARDVRGLPACTTALHRFADALRTPRAPEEVAALHALLRPS